MLSAIMPWIIFALIVGSLVRSYQVEHQFQDPAHNILLLSGDVLGIAYFGYEFFVVSMEVWNGIGFGIFVLSFVLSLPTVLASR